MSASKKGKRKLAGPRGAAEEVGVGVVREGGERVSTRVPKRAVKQMKSFRLAAGKIRRARKILGTTTDTGTIEAALDMVVFRHELLAGLGAMVGVKLVTPEAMDASSR